MERGECTIGRPVYYVTRPAALYLEEANVSREPALILHPLPDGRVLIQAPEPAHKGRRRPNALVQRRVWPKELEPRQVGVRIGGSDGTGGTTDVQGSHALAAG